MSELVWTTKDGQKLRLSQMTTAHINNALAHLRRQGFVGETEFDAAWSAALSFSGEMAQMLAENSASDLVPHMAIDLFEQELELRAQEGL